MRRRGGLLELIWNTPWLLALVIVLIVVAVGFWIWQQVKESQEAEKLRDSERNRRDSIWKD